MNKEHKFYIAYGSNLNVPQMRVRCPSATPYATGEMRDHQLAFRGNKSRAYLTIEPCKGKSVPIVVWKVTPKDERNLDMYEGDPTLYDKINVNLSDDMVGFTYVMNEVFNVGAPTEQYLNTCLEGYEHFGFDKEILLSANKLNNVKNKNVEISIH